MIIVSSHISDLTDRMVTVDVLIHDPVDGLGVRFWEIRDRMGTYLDGGTLECPNVEAVRTVIGPVDTDRLPLRVIAQGCQDDEPTEEEIVYAHPPLPIPAEPDAMVLAPCSSVMHVANQACASSSRRLAELRNRLERLCADMERSRLRILDLSVRAAQFLIAGLVSIAMGSALLASGIFFLAIISAGLIALGIYSLALAARWWAAAEEEDRQLDTSMPCT